MTATRSRSRILLAGLGSLLGILLILLGIPFALLVLGGNPLTELPTTFEGLWRTLSSPDDGSIFIALMTLAGWGLWATLALSLLLEVPATIRGVPAPRLPGLSWQQGRAAAMTGAVAAMLAIGGATTATAAPTTTTTTDGTVATAPRTAAESPATAESDRGPDSVTVRTGDTLWGIADTELGDGSRYEEIARANEQVRDPDVIQPGWQLDIPGSQHGERSDTGSTDKTAAAEAPQTPSETKTPDPTAGQADSDSSAVGSADTSTAGQAGPSTLPPRSGPPTTIRSDDNAPTETTAQHGNRLPIAESLGIGTLAAAGVLALLLLRRRQQGRHRAPGRRVAHPTGGAAAVESALRESADPVGVRDLDTALRSLGHGVAVGAHDLPSVRAARLLPDRVELYTVQEAQDLLPAPWQRVDQVEPDSPPEPGTWILLRRDLQQVRDVVGVEDAPAPWPAMVTVGFDEHNAHVLLNLEQIGALAITGDATTATDVIAGLGIELITSTWCDDAQITLVGVMPELVGALDNERVTHASDMDHVLTGLEHSARVFRDAFERAGVPDATTARAQGVVDEAWTPHLILTGQPLSQDQAQRLQVALETTPRVAVAAITSGTTPTGSWVLDVQPGPDSLPVADLAPAGMRLVPQHLTRQAYLDQLELFDTTSHQDVPGPQWAEHISDGAPFDLADVPQPRVHDAAGEEPASEGTDVPEVLDQDEAPGGGEVRPPFSIAAVNGTGSYGSSSLSATSWITTPTGPEACEEADAGAIEEESVSDAPLTEVGDSGPEVVVVPGARDDVADTETVTDSLTGDLDAPAAMVTPLPGAGGPVVKVLGRVEVVGARGPRPASHRRITEVIAYLVMNPGGDDKAFSAAIFPGEEIGPKLSHKRQTYMNTARRWLGRTPDGHPYVAEVDEGGYRVTPEVTLDWHHMQTLIGEDISAAGDEALHEALTLVTETPFSGVDPTRWDWASSDIGEICATVADVAHELATRALRTGDSRTAAWAATKGLLAEPVSEVLWRDQITAAWASGVSGRARTVITNARAALEPLGDDLEEDTVSLINDVISQERRHA